MFFAYIADLSYRDHLQATKFPVEQGPLPLLVFVHGLGGCAAQFGPLLTTLINVAPCLCIDLPGCGVSDFAPQDAAAYTTSSLVKLLAVIIDDHRRIDLRQKIVLVAHSIGCSLSALLASGKLENTGQISNNTIGLIAMCPRAEPLPDSQVAELRRIMNVPEFLFDMIRKVDRQGGPNSTSVNRVVGSDSDLQTRLMQLRYNEQSRSSVWRLMTSGILLGKEGDDSTGLPGEDVWQALNIPVFLVAGESDRIAPPDEVEDISRFLADAWKSRNAEYDLVDQFNQIPFATSPHTVIQTPRRAIKTTILPSPASHALPYSPATARTVSGLIQAFLAGHVDYRLSLGWQLTYLSDSGKWDVKNLQKWKGTPTTSIDRIAGVFLAMKTMREVDKEHCPKEFVKQWYDKIGAVVDISHESPVYDPKGLEQGGIEYHKFPSVSKLPPSEEEIAGFEVLIDKIRKDIGSKGEELGIAVHCHYGFNRTGYFVIGYMVDKLGYKLQDAIDEFAIKRPPGIKHDYFLDALFARYHPGIKRPVLSQAPEDLS